VTLLVIQGYGFKLQSPYLIMGPAGALLEEIIYADHTRCSHACIVAYASFCFFKRQS